MMRPRPDLTEIVRSDAFVTQPVHDVLIDAR
jgi:hypothetical protein